MIKVVLFLGALIIIVPQYINLINIMQDIIPSKDSSSLMEQGKMEISRSLKPLADSHKNLDLV